MTFLKMLFKRIVLLLIFYQLCRLLFLLFNLAFFDSLSFHSLPGILLGSLRFDISAIMYLNVVYIAMFVVPFNFRCNKVYRQTGKFIFILVNSISIIANLIDCAYFPFTLRRTNAGFFREFKNDTNLLFDLWKFLFSYWYIALLVILLVGLLIRSYDWIKTPEREPFKTKSFVLQLLLLPFLALIWLGFARGSFIPSDRPINISLAGQYVSNNDEISLVLNTPISIMTTWGNIKVPEVSYFASLAEAEKHYNPVQSYQGTDASKKNVVIIIVESLSREFVGALNSNIPAYVGYTPFLDSLIGRSLSFEYSFANGRRSIEALPSAIASIPSHTEAYILTPYSGNRINSIGSVLKKHHYSTSFFHGGHDGSMGFAGFMNLAGFDKSYSKKEYNNDADYDGTWGIYDEPFMQYWAKELNTFQQPFCSALFTVTSHHPFKIPEKYLAQFKEGNLPIHRSVRYTDYSLQKFFETASTMPWYKNTVFVITADHVSASSYYDKYQGMMGAFAVPVIFYTPDSSLLGFRNELIQQGDIFPTLIDYLGINDTIIAFGTSVLKSSTNDLVVNCYAGTYQAFSGDYALHFDGTKPFAFYRYKEDPNLRNNLLGKYPAEEEELLLKLKAYIQQYSYRVRENKMRP